MQRQYAVFLSDWRTDLGGTQSAVYATEVSAEEYLAYTTEETEKVEVYRCLLYTSRCV